MEQPAREKQPLPPPARGRRRISVKRVAVVVLGFYLLVCLLIFAFQRFIIYVPDRDVHATPQRARLAFEDRRLTTTDGVRIAAWYVPCDDARGTVLLLHGNAGNMADRLLAIAQFHRFGYRVLAIDYRGFGESDGTPSEDGTYLDAEAAWAYLVGERGEDPRRIVLYGESLGGGVAVELARRHRPGLLMVECTFTSIADAGQRMFKILPIGLIVRHHYRSIDKVGSIDCPKLFLHGRGDGVVPFDLGRRLFDAAAEPKEFIETPGGHSDGGFLYNDEVTARAREAMARLLGNERPLSEPRP